MKFQKLEQNTFALIFDKGDEFISVLTSFAKEKDLGGSHFTAIGAFRTVMLGYFDRDKKHRLEGRRTAGPRACRSRQIRRDGSRRPHS